MNPFAAATTWLIDESKISVYLLNPEHPKNKGKAKFLTGFGFRLDAPSELADAFALHAFKHQPGIIVTPLRGPSRYVFEGSVTAPDGREIPLRTVWELNPPNQMRFITAVPLTR